MPSSNLLCRRLLFQFASAEKKLKTEAHHVLIQRNMSASDKGWRQTGRRTEIVRARDYFLSRRELSAEREEIHNTTCR